MTKPEFLQEFLQEDFKLLLKENSNLLKEINDLEQSLQFYKNRCELIEKVQKYMRDPERQIVCDILANNNLLPDPSGARYGQDLRKLIN